MRRSWLLALVILALVAPAARAGQAPVADELKSSNPDVRARAARDLGRQGDAAAVPALASALNDPSTKVRREVVVALSQIHAPASTDALITATRDTDPDVRVLAVQAVTGSYTGQSPKLGFSGFVKKNVTGRFESDDTRIDPGVQVDPKVITALEAAMADERSIEAARQAAKGLGILVAKSAVPSLVKAAHSSDEVLAWQALNALAKIKDISAGPQIVDVLDSSSKPVREEAAVTVGILRATSAESKLRSMYETSGDKKVRQAALEGLAYLGAASSYDAFISALTSRDKTDRAYAAEGLARVRDQRALPELQKALAVEKDAGARLAMDFALASLGQHDALSDLVEGLKSTLRGDVARAYLIELARDPQFLAKLYPYLKNSDAGVRRKLCVVLMYSGDRSSLGPLEQLSHDSNGDVAAAALRARRAILART